MLLDLVKVYPVSCILYHPLAYIILRLVPLYPVSCIRHLASGIGIRHPESLFQNIPDEIVIFIKSGQVVMTTADDPDQRNFSWIYFL